MSRVKEALGRQFLFQLLKGNIQIAHAVDRQGHAVQLIGSVSGVHGDLAHGDDLHAVFRPEPEPHGIALEHNTAQGTGLVLQSKIVVAGRVLFVVADLAPDGHGIEKRVGIHPAPDVFVQLGNGKHLLLHGHTSVQRPASTATPMALSVEYWGWAKMGFRGSKTCRRSVLEATPPENTTGSPG